MARKSRSKKRKAKKKAAPSQQKLEASAEVDTATIEPDDVVIGAPPASEDQPVAPPIVRQAEVIEIRPAPEESEPEPELGVDDMAEGIGLDWVEPAKSVPLPKSEEVAAPEDLETLEELESLQSELDEMLAEGEKAMTQEEVIEEPLPASTDKKRIVRFERKLKAADRLPTDLDDVDAEDSSSDATAASAPSILAEAPKAFPETSSPWGTTKAGSGGEVAEDQFYGKRNFLSVIEQIPLLGKLLICDGALRPLVIFIAVFAPIVTLIFVLVLSFMKGPEDGLRSVSPGALPREQEKSVPMEEIEDAVRDFAKAATWEEKLKYVRAAGHVVEALRGYYEEHAMDPAEDVTIERAERVEMNGLDLFKVEATLLPQKEVVTLMLERDPRSYLKVDWAVAVDYQEADWQQFYDDQVESPTTLRVALAVQSKPYHNYQFEDTEKYRGYRIWYPESSFPHLNGYAEIGSDLDNSLQALLKSASGYVPVILSLAYPEGAQDPSMVRIVELISPNWVVDYEARARSQE